MNTMESIEAELNNRGVRTLKEGIGPSIVAIPTRHLDTSLELSFQKNPNSISPTIVFQEELYATLTAIRSILEQSNVDWCFIDEQESLIAEDQNLNTSRISNAKQIHQFNEIRKKENPHFSLPISVAKATSGQDHYAVSDTKTRITLTATSINIIFDAIERFQADCLIEGKSNIIRPGRTEAHVFYDEWMERWKVLKEMKKENQLRVQDIQEFSDWYRSGVGLDFQSRHEQILSQCTADVNIVTLGFGHFKSLGHLQSCAPSFESQATQMNDLSVYKLHTLPLPTQENTHSINFASSPAEDIFSAVQV